MARSFLYFTGLGLTFLGLIGILSEIGAVLIRYLVLGLGLSLLTIFFIKQKQG